MDSLNTYKESLEKLKKSLLPAESVVIIPHDFPDPDSLGAAVGIQQLLRHEGVTQCDVAFAGFVGRAENRAMVELLELKHLHIPDINIAEYDKVLIVDTTPDNGTVSIDKNIPVAAVLDHHTVMEYDEESETFYDIHKEVGATSTLVTTYLLISGTPIPPKVATALFYGIKTDTQDMGRNCHDIDIYCYKELFDLIDHKILSNIEHPPRDPEYLQLFHAAAESMEIYGDFGHSHLGEVKVPDYVPEMADICHSLKQLEWMVCSAIFQNQIIFSIRSKKNPNAGIIAKKLADTLHGSGGGHQTMAAGRIECREESAHSLLQNFKKVIHSLFAVEHEQKTTVFDIDTTKKL